jgi:hypothetical protein
VVSLALKGCRKSKKINIITFDGSNFTLSAVGEKKGNLPKLIQDGGQASDILFVRVHKNVRIIGIE